MSKLIDYAEDNFDCQFGVPQAYFDIPQTDGNTIRVIYVVYCASSDDPNATNEWMLESVLKPLRDAGGKYLYWRHKDQIEEYLENGRFYTYARIAMLDNDLNPVVITTAIKAEGEPGIILDKGVEDE